MVDVEQQDTTTKRKCSCNCCDFLWIVTSAEGWLKLVEAIMTFLTFVIVSTFPGSYKAEYEFLIFVATTAFVFVVLHIILRMTHLFEKLPPALTQPLIGLIGCSLATLALVIGSAIVYARGSEYNLTTLEASGICGFLSSALFCLEAVYLLFRHRRASKSLARKKTTEEVQTDDFALKESNPGY